MNKKEIINIYPVPDENNNRNVINLSRERYPNNFKIELVAKKFGIKDCNMIAYPGTIEEKYVEGWGYSYYIITVNELAISTYMACSENFHVKKEYIDVIFNNGKNLLPYNDKLPIVVYAPKNVDIYYKIWKTNNILRYPVVL